jgi:hypothetical protein
MDLTERIEGLLRETGRAHHEAFLETGGEDPEWPLWYAEYLQERLGELLGAEFTKSEIVYLVMTLEDMRTRSDPAADWARYYASVLAASL